RDALLESLKAGLGATAIAIVLGSLAALAVGRHHFFGRETISFLVILPLALLGIGFGLFTIIVGHATFCIVTIYNNVLARLRRSSPNFEEASADLGADSWTTFRLVT